MNSSKTIRVLYNGDRFFSKEMMKGINKRYVFRGDGMVINLDPNQVCRFLGVDNDEDYSLELYNYAEFSDCFAVKEITIENIQMLTLILQPDYRFIDLLNLPSVSKVSIEQGLEEARNVMFYDGETGNLAGFKELIVNALIGLVIPGSKEITELQLENERLMEQLGEITELQLENKQLRAQLGEIKKLLMDPVINN